MEPSRFAQLAGQLFQCIHQVTAEEFYWQDANFNSNLRRGRELLYLIANDEWIPSTTERINVSRPDLIDTDLVLKADLTLIRHEAFHGNGEPVWLPLLVLLMSDDADRIGDLRVADAQGALQATVPPDRIQHAAAAAMAELIVSTAAAHWPPKESSRPPSHRDLQLLLAAAAFRLLHEPVPDSGASAAPHRTPRIRWADDNLSRLLGQYAGQVAGTGGPSPARRLTEHAAEVLDALSRAVIVAVAADRHMPPAVFTVTTPTRELGPPGHIRPDWLSRLRPHAELQIDLLFPSAHADRHIEVSLPDGVSLTDSRESLVIKVEPPPSARMLGDLMRQILSDEPRTTGDDAATLCIADLALTTAAAFSHALAQHQVVPEGVDDPLLHRVNSPVRRRISQAARPPGTVASGTDAEARAAIAAATRDTRDRLSELQTALRELTSAASPPDGQLLSRLREAWSDGRWLGDGMLRRTLASRQASSTRTVAGLARAGHPSTDQATPVYAKIVVPVKAAESKYISIARLSGLMSAVMMAILALFSLFFAMDRHGGITLAGPSVGAVATVITLFAVILAGRTGIPDGSMLDGYLSARGNWFIVASVLPSIVLAIALAFDDSGCIPAIYAGITLAAQLALLAGMSRRVLYGRGGRQPRVLSTWSGPGPSGISGYRLGYQRAHLLRSPWWQTTTASALVKNQPAFGYVGWGQGQDALPSPANILSMLRVRFGGSPMTFVVLRDQPAPASGWTDIDLDLTGQATVETPPDEVDVFVGSPGTAGTAAEVRGLCAIAADYGLMVLNARMPEPPRGGDPDRVWARLRLGLRHGESTSLRPLLRAMSHGHAGRECDIHVRTARGGTTRFVYPPGREGEAVPVSEQRPVKASDLDPVKPPHSSYRVLALHASAHIGIEREILRTLAKAEPGLELAAISYAVLHGTSVFLLLGVVPAQRAAAEADAAARLFRIFAAVDVHVDIDEIRTGAALGQADDSPLLRVLLRTPDRPGALSDAVDALKDALSRVVPEEREGASGALGHIIPGRRAGAVATSGNLAGFWHGVLESGAARTTTVRLTRQLPPASDVSDWDDDVLRGIEHRTQLNLTKRAAMRQAGAVGDTNQFGAPEDAVVDVKLIKSASPPVIRGRGR